MKRLRLILTACVPCLSLACAGTSAAYRTPVLIVLGVLSVALLILFGKPSAKKPEKTPKTAPEPVADTEEEPKDNPERSE